MSLTRYQGTMIGVAIAFIIALFAFWMYSSIDTSVEPERPIMRGPNSDGSWGEYIEYTRPLVKATGAQVNKATGEVTIFMVVDVGIYGKYSTHITLPLDKAIKEE